MSGVARAAGTQRQQNRIIKDFTKFIHHHGIAPLEVDEDIILSFVMKAYTDQKSYNYVSMLKGSIMTFLAATGLSKENWSLTTDRVVQGIIRILAPTRQRRAKVEQLPGEIIAKMLKWVVPNTPKNTSELDNISGKNFRTVVLLIIQYYALARLADVRKLRAGDLRLVKLEGYPAVEILFRTMKNDPTGNGSVAHIIEEPGQLCPYKAIKLYYARCAYYFNDGHIDDLNFLLPRFRMAKVTRILIPDGRVAVAESTLVANIKSLAKSVGFEGKVSGKSAKIGGTSASFAVGLSDAEVRDKGRWRTLDTAQYYRRISDSHKLKLARSISIQTQPQEKRNLNYHESRGTNCSYIYNPEVQFMYVEDAQNVNEDNVSLEQKILTVIQMDT